MLLLYSVSSDERILLLLIGASMLFSLIRKNAEDSTRWIPLNEQALMRGISMVAVMAVSLLTAGYIIGSPAILIYAGDALLLAGAFFFFGAKSPFSRILTRGEYGVRLEPKGLYNVMRHPYFFGILLTALGYSVALASLPGLTLSLLMMLPVLLRSSRALDEYWSRRSGTAYVEYAEEVPMFIPRFSVRRNKSQ